MTWKWSLLIFRIFLRIRSSRVLHQHEILWRNPFSRISDCHTIKGVEEQESPPVSLVHICSTSDITLFRNMNFCSKIWFYDRLENSQVIFHYQNWLFFTAKIFQNFWIFAPKIILWRKKSNFEVFCQNSNYGPKWLFFKHSVAHHIFLLW